MSVLSSSDSSLSKEELLLRLEEAEETLRAIRSGEVDALVVSGEQGDQVFTLKDATLPYQTLIEEMNEGALTLSSKGVILYCNSRFAEMLGVPMESILGKSFLQLVIHSEQARATALLEQRVDGKSKGELILKSARVEIPVGISMKEIRLDGEVRLGVVVSDLTERKQIEAELRHYQEQLEERVSRRTLDLKTANAALSASRLAALNLMDDALTAQRQVRESNQKLNEILVSIQDDFFVVNRNWEFVYVNDIFASHIGKSPVDFSGKNVWEMFPRYIGTVMEENLRAAMEKREVRRFEVEGKYTATWYRMNAFPSTEGITVLGTDITERKKAEENLQRFQLLSENSRDIILFMRFPDGQILNANAAAIEAYGYSREELLSLKIQDLRRDNATKLTAEQMTQANESGILFETIHRRKDGSSFPVEVSSQGSTIGGVRTLISIVRDITERRQAEEALARTNQKLNEILFSIQDDFYVLDRDWNFVYANTLFASKIGKEPADFIGKNIWTMFPQHVGTVVEENFTASMEKREVSRFEVGGKYIESWYRITAFPSAEGITVLGTDITERKKAEIRLQQLNRTLQAMSASNQAMMRARSEAELLDEVCKIVVQDCGYAMVWIGYAEHGEEQLVRPMASAGFEEGYLETLKITWADTERGQGPTGTAIRTGKPQGCRDMLTDPQFAPWREEAQKRHYRSSLVLPLQTKGHTFGAITIYSREPEAFSTDEQALLTELASDLTNGIEMIRLREIRALIEAQLRLARDELEIRVEQRTAELATANRKLSDEITERKEIERQLRIQSAAMAAAANGIIITDPKGCILWTNPAITKISGYEQDDLVGQSTRIFSSGTQDPAFYQNMWEMIRSGRVWHGELTNRRKDGTEYIEEQTITPVWNEDAQISHYISIKQDVTERKLMYAQLEDSNRDLQLITASERRQRFLAEGLAESSIVLNMSLELHDVLDHIFQQTRHTIPYLMADIVLIEDGVANVVRQWGEGNPEARTIFENDSLPLQQFPIWQKICETRSTVIIPDVHLDDQWDSYFGMRWIRSYIGAPLIYDDQVIGIINLISDQADAFHEHMARNLRAFAAPAAVAIQNAKLYETEQQNRKAAEILSAASVALAQTLDIQMVMEAILDYVQFILPIDVAFVILSEGDELYRIRAVRTSDDHNELRELFLDQSLDMLSDPIARSYVTSHENTYIPDPRDVPAWNPPPALGFLNCWLGMPLQSMGKILGIVVAAHSTPNSFTRNQIHLMEAVVRQGVVALQNAWLFDQVRSGRERLQQLSRHLVEIQENERKYIARELHDETSQSLTSLKIGLQVIEQKAAGHQLLLDQIAKLKALADETLESLHRLAVNLRPASLDHLGLVDALTGLIEMTRQRSGIAAHFKIMGSVQASLVTEELETSIYRIVQESLTNVIRHAHAAHVDIILEWQHEKIVIIIEDDGVGIDMQKARESGHLGLIGMQERAEMLGGKLLVDSTPQVGTTLVVEIPYVHTNTIGG